MYFAHVTLFFVLCVISKQTTFDRQSQSITDITVHTIPAGTTIVRFDWNSITYIPGSYFENLLNLDEIWLIGNAITDFADTAFSQVPSVTKICLQQNQLTVIREMMFSGLPNLSDLRISLNQIHTIEQGSFKNNMALTILAIHGNSLETVSQSIFAPNNHPTSLDLIYMYNNPLQCDQDLCWIKQDNTITVAVATAVECIGPAALAGRMWDTLTEHEICNTPVSTPYAVQGKGYSIWDPEGGANGKKKWGGSVKKLKYVGGGVRGKIKICGGGVT